MVLLRLRELQDRLPRASADTYAAPERRVGYLDTPETVLGRFGPGGETHNSPPGRLRPRTPDAGSN